MGPDGWHPAAMMDGVRTPMRGDLTPGTPQGPARPGDNHPPPMPEDLWHPRSSCDRRCHDQASGRSAGAVRQTVRALTALPLLLGTLCLALAGHVLLRRGGRGLRGWFRAFLRALGIRFTVHGQPPPPGRGSLLVCNHISWLDLVAVNAVVPARFVVKSELRSTPVVSVLARSRASIYLDRSRPKSLPATVAEVAEALRAGAPVGVFPEGTTWCGARGGSYRSAVFQAAIDAQVPVRPVVVRYRTVQREAATSAALVDSSLLQCVRRVLAERRLHLELHLLPEIPPGTAPDRRELAAQVQAAADAVRFE